MQTEFNQAAANDNAPNLDWELISAAEMNEIDKVKDLLARGADIDTRRTSDKSTPVIIAAHEGYAELASYLAGRPEKAADLSLTTSIGQTVVHAALKAGAPEIAIEAIRKGAPTDTTDMHGATGAFYAAQNNYADVVDALAEAGADLDIPNKTKTTPLMHAIKFGHNQTMAALIQKGAKLEAQDEHGMTALMHAAACDRVMAAKVLIVQNLTLETKNDEGLTAAGIARDRGHDEIAELLEAAIAHHYKPFHKGSDEGVRPMKALAFRPKDPR